MRHGPSKIKKKIRWFFSSLEKLARGVRLCVRWMSLFSEDDVELLSHLLNIGLSPYDRLSVAMKTFGIVNDTGYFLDEDWPLLYTALYFGAVQCVELLLCNGASANASGPLLGDDPLHHLSRCKSVKRLACGNLLLKANANVNAKNAVGHTPLHVATFWGHADILLLLLGAGAKVDEEDHLSITALALAIQKQNPACAQVLVHAGAKLHNVHDIPIPDWLNKIVAKHNNFKSAFVTLYGILRKRLAVPNLFNPHAKGIPYMVRMIAELFVQTRFDQRWSCSQVGANDAFKRSKNK